MRNLDPLQVPSEEETQLLRIIANKHPITATEASEMAGYEHSRQIAPLISRLKKKGLIEVEESEMRGRRVYRAYLRATKAGKEALEIIDSGIPYETVKAFKVEI